MVAHRIGGVQARLALFVFHFLVLCPFALALKAAAVPLGIRRSGSRRSRPEPEAEVRTLVRRQF